MCLISQFKVERISPSYLQKYTPHTASASTSGLRDAVVRDYGGIDILIHAVANAPEVRSPLLETSRAGYSAAIGT